MQNTTVVQISLLTNSPAEESLFVVWVAIVKSNNLE